MNVTPEWVMVRLTAVQVYTRVHERVLDTPEYAASVAAFVC